MASPSLTYTLTNGTTADASQVLQDLNDLLLGYTDGTRDLTALSFTGTTVTTTNLAAGTFTIGNNFRLTSTGIIEYAGANTPGWTSNVGVGLAAGVFSVFDAQGASFSATNPGWVTVPSTTAGQLATLKITANHTFNDDSHASSDLSNLGFGITEAADWANDMPFFLYVVNRSNSNLDGVDGSSSLFIARHPCMHTTPASANDIGDIGAIPVNDSQDVILIMSDVTVANYVSLPCQLVGAFRMQWSTTTDDWTVQTLGNTDGVGPGILSMTFAKTWTFPAGQNGAVAGRFMMLNGGTSVAQWTDQTYFYKVRQDGQIWVSFEFNGDGGTDGVGAVALQLVVPYVINTDHVNDTVFGIARAVGSAVATNGHTVRGSDLAIFFTFSGVDGASGTQLDINDFGAGARTFKGSIIYPAFVV